MPDNNGSYNTIRIPNLSSANICAKLHTMVKRTAHTSVLICMFVPGAMIDLTPCTAFLTFNTMQAPGIWWLVTP